MSKVISKFTIGGTEAGPSITSGIFQRAIGNEIRVNTCKHELYVPTKYGRKTARPGDTVVAYDDNSFDVEYVEREDRENED